MRINKTLLYRSSWRYYLKRPLHLFFSVLGIALGVALVVGIDMASQSARQGFSLSTQSITGKASHRIISAEHVLPESIYVQLRNELGLRKVTPLITQTLQFNVPDNNNQSKNKQEKKSLLIDVKLIGIDPFSEAEIRSWQQGVMTSLSEGSLQRLLTETNTVLLERNFLKQYHLQVGDQISLTLANHKYAQQIQLLIIGSFNAPEAYQTQLKNWLISDISNVQELLNYKGGSVRLICCWILIMNLLLSKLNGFYLKVFNWLKWMNILRLLHA